MIINTKKSKVKVSKVRRELRVLHVTENFVFHDFEKQNFNHEKELYNELRNQSNTEKFSLLDIPADNPLIKIIEEKRLRFLKYWNKDRIPIGGGSKSDKRITRDFKNLRIVEWCDVLRMDDNGSRNILWDFSSLDSGLNQYFPEMMDVPTTKGSVLECLRDRKRFFEGYENKIFKDGMHRFKTEKSNFLSVFKEMIRLGSGSHPVVNFPSKVAQHIVIESYYNTIKLSGRLENDNFVVLDPCAGWAGRLLGVLCSFHKLRNDYRKRYDRELLLTYLTTDPNTDVHDRFKNIVKDWFEDIEPKGYLEFFKFYKNTIGCETTEFLDYCKSVLSDLNLSGVNVALTSPPYFDREQYSKDENQSFKKYPIYKQWVDNFLTGMIKNVHELLVPHGRFYLNIANTKEQGDTNRMQDDSVRILKKTGMSEVITYKMTLSGTCRSENAVIINGICKKYEPVFVSEKSIHY